jgi:hypothetical protein
MPSLAVIAKNALIEFMEKLSARFGPQNDGPISLPTWDEWISFSDLTRDVLHLKELPIDRSNGITWKDFMRLEKAYRRDLKFEKWLLPILVRPSSQWLVSTSSIYAN